MKLKNKLFLLLSCISLLSFVLMGFLGQHMVHTKIFNETVFFLDTIADFQEKRVKEVISHYLSNFKLASSRIQLIIKPLFLNEILSPEEKISISLILEDFRKSMSGVEVIDIINPEGQLISSSDPSRIDKKIADDLPLKEVKHHAQLTDLFKNEANQIRARIMGPLFLENDLAAFMIMEREADELISITTDQTGLGMSGEVLLAKRNSMGDAVILTPLLFDGSAALNRAVPNELINKPIIEAVNGTESISNQNIIDYRNEPVIAVSRFIEGLEWGLVVKVDQKEALGLIDRMLKNVLLPSAIILFFILIPLVFILSRMFTRQFKAFMGAIRKLKKGDFSFRIKIKKRDEIGLLAEAFNSMGKKLKTFYQNLEEKVQSRTKELKTANAKNEAILSSIKESLIFIDTNERILMMNKMAETLTGYKEKSVLGEKLKHVIRLKVMKGRIFYFKKCGAKKLIQSKHIQSIHIKTEDNHYMSSKDKRLFPVSILASKVFNDDQLIGVIILFRDVSKEKEITQIKNEFISMASYQLRTPLTSIQWYLDMVTEESSGILSQSQSKYLRKIRKNTLKMNRLVNDLLNASYLESGELKIETEEKDIDSFIKEIVEDLKIIKENKNIKITNNIDPSLKFFKIDIYLMNKILRDLLLNAIEYGSTPNKICKIEIRIYPKGKNICIEVEDSGPGIAKEMHHLIFKKFVRSEYAREKNPEGLGLSLYILKLIMELAGGQLLFDNKNKKGALFLIVLPKTGMKSNINGRRLFR